MNGDSSAPVGHVSAGLVLLDRAALKEVPFSACSVLWLGLFSEDLLPGGGEGLGDRLVLPARNPSARCGGNMVSLKARRLLVLLRIVVCSCKNTPRWPENL